MSKEEVITHLNFIKAELMPDSPSDKAIDIAIAMVSEYYKSGGAK